MYETATGQQRDEIKGRVIGRLSVIVAPGKRGDIVVRATDLEKEKGLEMLVRNFLICYGLKKEMFSIILQNLYELVQNRT